MANDPDNSDDCVAYTMKDLEGTLTFGPCPNCGLEIRVRLNAEGTYPVNVIHRVPMCRAFDEMNADEYLTYVMDIRDAERQTPIDE